MVARSETWQSRVACLFLFPSTHSPRPPLQVVSKMLEVNPTKRPVIFALSNPMTQAEVRIGCGWGVKRRWTGCE